MEILKKLSRYFRLMKYKKESNTFWAKLQRTKILMIFIFLEYFPRN